MQTKQDAPLSITIRLLALRRRWRVVAGATLLAMAMALVALSLMQPQYTASAQLLLDARRLNILQNQALLQGLPLDTASIESEVSLLRSFNVAQRVVEKLSLAEDPEFVSDGISPFTWLSSLWRAPLQHAGVPEAVHTPAPPGPEPTPVGPQAVSNAAVRTLQRNLQVRRVDNTLVVEITYRSPDPAKAARIANAIADAYLTEQLDARYEAAHRASGWLNERLSGLRARVMESEKQVADYRSAHHLVETASGGVDRQQVADIRTQIALARAQVAEKKAKYDQAHALLETGGNLAAGAVVLQSQVAADLRTQEAELARKEADLTARYGELHPQVLNVRVELADIRRAIASEVRRVASNIQNEYEVAVKREQSLQESLEKLTSIATQGDEVGIKLRELEREADSNRAIYQTFLTRFKEAREQTTLETTDTRVISPALVPGAPSFPRKDLVLAVALCLGLGAGVFAALVLERVESGFVTVEQAESLLKLPVLSVLPQLRKTEFDPRSEGMQLHDYIRREPLSRLSEAIRAVKAGLAISDVDNPPKTVLVTSGVPGEGKSSLSACLAVSAATAGLRVLLIDADLRHPITTRNFRLEGAPGLVDLLTARAEPKQAVHTLSTVGLSVLPAGTITANAPDILGSQKLQVLLQSLRDLYDLVVVDTPPLTAVVDAVLISKSIDKVVFVIEWKKTPREVVARSLNVLGGVRARVAGLVLTKANVKALRHHNTYYGYYLGRNAEHYEKYYKH